MRTGKKRSWMAWLLLWCAMAASAQGSSALDELRSDPRKAYGTDYPYPAATLPLTKAPRGYKPFYISHYARHGSRYYWTDALYKELDTLLTLAHRRHQLTPAGEALHDKFMAAKGELMAGMGELTDLGWEQHQRIARTMYESFPAVFRKGGRVLAISSLSGRCVISMAAFCQELTQQNPKIEIREQSARHTLDGVVPTDRQNPAWRPYPKARPRYEAHRDRFRTDNHLRADVVSRVLTSTDSLPGSVSHIGSNLINLYTSLPSIGHEGMMEGILTDEEIAAQWEEANLGSYSWVFADKYRMIPILRDILRKADDAISGASDHIADLRFGHDSCLGPLTVLMGINGADADPDDPYEVKNCYQSWETCKASNLQLVFYRGKRGGVLVKCLLNGQEARLPMATTMFPYYKWSDVKQFYEQRCQIPESHE